MRLIGPNPIKGVVSSSSIDADAITGAKIADDALDSEHYTDGSIDAAHLAADVVTGAKIADDALDSEHYTDGSIDTAHLAADAVTGAKIADDALDSEHYTDGSIDLAHMSSESVDEDNLHISNAGSNGQFLSKQSGNAGGLTWADAGGGFTLGTEQATTSGTTITFSSIPSGTKMIVVQLESVSFTGSANLDLTIGDSGGLETSGYASATMRGSTNIFDSSAFVMYMQGQGANTVSGSMILTLKDSSNHDWVASHAGGSDSSSAGAFAGGGHKSLSGELTQLQLSGGTFDNGSANILYM